MPKSSARKHAECEEQERPATRAVLGTNIRHQALLEGHAYTQPLKRGLCVVLSQISEQLALRVADCTFTEVTDQEGSGVVFQQVDGSDQAIQSTREQADGIEGRGDQTRGRRLGDCRESIWTCPEADRPAIARQEVQRLLEDGRCCAPASRVADRHDQPYLARPRILGLFSARDASIGRMDMGGQYHQIDADFRRKHADLLQTRERASDTVV
ncbi:hypothetical protein D9M68_582430 [compost metagenome]